MASVSERPTQVHPTTPAPPAERSGGLTPHEPAVPGPGGPGEPPRPPRRTGGGGGGGGGGDHGDGGPDDPDRRNRTSKIATIGAGLVLLVVVLVLAFGGGEEDDAKIADTTPSAQSSPAPSGGETSLQQVPDETPAPAEAEPTPDADASSGQDDSDAATTPQEETGGIAVGGAGQTGDASDSADAEAESTAPLLTAGKVAKLTFKQGDTVRFRVESDTAQEVHVHGYDKKYDLGAGETQTIAFPANLTGIFEVEFEETGTQIGELTIEP